MASMNSGIILSGANPNLMSRVAQGMQMRHAKDEMDRQNALADLYQQHGAGLVSGDAGAINALAAVDPMGAARFQQAQVDNRRAGERHQMAMEAGRREAEAHAAKMSAAERAETAQRIQQGLAAASHAQSPEQWDALAQQYGAPELVGKFDERDAVIGYYTGQLAELQKPMSAPGKVQADIDAGFLPPGTELRSPQVVVNTGNEIDPRPITDKPDKGYQRRWDEERQTYVDEPIPGGSEDTSKQDAARQNAQETAGDVILSAAIRARDADSNRVATGLIGALASNNPASHNAEVYRQVEVLKANATIEALNAMRQQSPTGGALGNVTEGEGRMLAAKSGALDPTSPTFERDLADYTQTLLRVIHGREAGDAIFAQRWNDAAPPKKDINDGNPYSGMSRQELIGIDPMQLSDEQVDQLLEALRQ